MSDNGVMAEGLIVACLLGALTLTLTLRGCRPLSASRLLLGERLPPLPAPHDNKRDDSYAFPVQGLCVYLNPVPWAEMVRVIKLMIVFSGGTGWTTPVLLD
jgi:hypothetical protein